MDKCQSHMANFSETSKEDYFEIQLATLDKDEFTDQEKSKKVKFCYAKQILNGLNNQPKRVTFF